LQTGRRTGILPRLTVSRLSPVAEVNVSASSPSGGADPIAEVDGLSRLLATVEPRLGGDDVDLVRRAHNLAEVAHGSQRRVSGEPYITHPVAVAQIVAELGLDAPTIAAALLHDVVEDTELSPANVAAAFGEEVARLVVGVTKISAIEARENAPSEAENLRRMLLAAVDDLRVILVKLADRLHNMQTLDALDPDRQRRKARETLEIYAPLANRLGIWQFKSEFEDLALKALYPQDFEAITRELADRRHQHDAYLADVIAHLRAPIAQQHIRADISSRTKHLYSIYRKMQRKGISADQIYDVLAVRIVVDEIGQCYLALGIVHTLWQPIAGQFDDFIAKRKNNLYQSLHTTVLGPGNRPLEIQIRTRDMDEVAEYGVAAHWKYKEDGQRSSEIEEKITALRRLLKSQDEDASDAESFVEALKTDVFRDQVYVFTPRGDVVELPAGSTPIDFAYHIHTEVGHRCRGALVNDRMVPLDTPLQTGQTVRIITARGAAGPSRDWLNPALGFVASNRSRETIRQWFTRQARSEAVREGREVLERVLRKLGLTRVRQDEAARIFEFERVDDFLAAVGRHDIPSETIAARLLETYAPATPPRPQPGAGTDAGPRPGAAPVTGVSMRGVDRLQSHAAACCRPLPGDDVLGYVTRGKGVTLHRTTCHNIARLRDREPDRFIRVHWENSDRQSYPVELQVLAYDRPALVRDISDVIARMGMNMISINAVTNAAEGTALVTAIVDIASLARLAALIDRLAALDNVIDVHRPEG
jgi:GTP diphosphokinase / guanosine-3',5'-bis(diphosphate) 3'-diphosphatase